MKKVPLEPKVTARLQSYYHRYKRLPSVSELAALFGYASKSGAAKLIDKLCERRIIKKDKTGKLIPTAALLGGVKLLGVVQAGFPSPAEEELIDTLSMDEFLIHHPESTYLVKVSGDSMINAGIHPNDLVLVERGREAKHNDIVIAEVDGEWTMKYYIKRGSQVILRAANKRYKDITPKEHLEIGGVVTACIRKYAK